MSSPPLGNESGVVSTEDERVFFVRYKDTTLFVQDDEVGRRIVAYYDGHPIAVDSSLIPNLIGALQMIYDEDKRRKLNPRINDGEH
jgi:hypothetical protein